MHQTSVYLFCDSYWPARGGVEEFVRSLASLLPSEFHITVMPQSAGNSSGTPITAPLVFLPSAKPYFDPDGHEVHPLKLTFVNRLMLIPSLLWYLPFVKRCWAKPLYDYLYLFYKRAFSKQLRRELVYADIVHCFSTGYLARCVVEICKKLNLPVVMSPPIHFGKWGDSPGQMNAYSEADVVTCLTEHFKQQMISKWGTQVSTRLEVIPPVIANAEPCVLAKDPVPKPFVLFLGRREAHKGLAMLLVAYRGLEHLANLVVVGPGSDLQTRWDGIYDLGTVDDRTKKWLLNNCELLCVPSLDESFGIVYAEAMSYGKPVVALDTAPLDEIIKNEKTGILVRYEDTDGLRMALGRLLMDKELRRRMGEAALKYFNDKYSSDKVVSKFVSLYKELLVK